MTASGFLSDFPSQVTHGEVAGQRGGFIFLTSRLHRSFFFSIYISGDKISYGCWYKAHHIKMKYRPLCLVKIYVLVFFFFIVPSCAKYDMHNAHCTVYICLWQNFDIFVQKDCGDGKILKIMYKRTVVRS